MYLYVFGNWYYYFIPFSFTFFSQFFKFIFCFFQMIRAHFLLLNTLKFGQIRQMANINCPLSMEEEQMLVGEAARAQQNAYIPYSKFPVGAALLNQDGQIFRGVNVENASYGATVCAERSAICCALSILGPSKFRPKAIAVSTYLDNPGSPCGICRQVLAEFGDFPVLLFSRTTKKLVRTSVHELLPMAFTPGHLDEFNAVDQSKTKS